MWHPSCNLDLLKRRAKLLSDIRAFFAVRGVMEVETPLIAPGANTDCNIASLKVADNNASDKPLYLQTSPEFYMKRLLAAGSGPIFQICKAFRDDEVGVRHNPEFTMLEWYRPGFNHLQLIDEVETLLQKFLPLKPAIRISYQQLFIEVLQINPLTATTAQLQQCAVNNKINIDATSNDKDFWLNLLFCHKIEPFLQQQQFAVVYDYPASQAALAKLSESDKTVAERFEFFINGIEMANGFNELTDGTQQLQRFENDNYKRQENNLPLMPIDQKFIAAVDNIPPCAGVALGIDRLLMLMANKSKISEVLSFDFNAL